MFTKHKTCFLTSNTTMEGCKYILSDSSSDKTIIVDNNKEVDQLLKKYSSAEYKPSIASTSSKADKNFYNLDEFSDVECDYEPLEDRIRKQSSNTNAAWQEKFSAADFCEDSNDFDTVLKRINQLESEQFRNESRHSISKEIETLIHANIIQEPTTSMVNDDIINLSSGSFNEPAKSDNSSMDSSSENLLAAGPKPKRAKKKVFPSDKEAKKREKEIAKAAKAKEREEKKLEKEKQKQLKNALKVIENCVKPDQCIQYLTVNIDEKISNTHYGDVIKAGLKSGGYNFKVTKQVVPNLISWERKVPTIENMFLENIHQQEKHHLIIMDIPEFIQLIADNMLTGHVQSLLSIPQIDHLTIAVLGLQSYLKYLKEERNREFKANIANTENIKKTNNEYKNLPKISKKQIDMKLVELQIFCKNIYIRPVQKFEDLAMFVGECTKSVAQIPYKLAKAESSQQENEYFSVNNRDCVKVDKDGNGLNRLWNQFLRLFPLASLETAEAVTSAYPTMHSLMEAYKNCDKPEDGEKLLQNIPVRRAAGPLGGQRRLGPEFSKRAYRFFSSKENVLL